MNLPSIKTLETVFGDNARHARAVLEMKREELFGLTGAAGAAVLARDRECYHTPNTVDLKLQALNVLAGTMGDEAFQLRDGTWCYYLNAGDTYSTTLIWLHGRWRVACWGDVAERYAD